VSIVRREQAANRQAAQKSRLSGVTNSSPQATLAVGRQSANLRETTQPAAAQGFATDPGAEWIFCKHSKPLGRYNARNDRFVLKRTKPAAC
jgi:hypothetical protein